MTPTTEKTTEELQAEITATREAMNELLVAVRGGGNLTPACDAAQAFLDGTTEEAEEGDATDTQAAEEAA